MDLVWRMCKDYLLKDDFSIGPGEATACFSARVVAVASVMGCMLMEVVVRIAVVEVVAVAVVNVTLEVVVGKNAMSEVVMESSAVVMAVVSASLMITMCAVVVIMSVVVVVVVVMMSAMVKGVVALAVVVIMSVVMTISAAVADRMMGDAKDAGVITGGAAAKTTDESMYDPTIDRPLKG
jgi:hypothetical protein